MKVWVVGAGGMLAAAVQKQLRACDVPHVGTDRRLDIRDAAALGRFAATTPCTHLINCAAYTKVDACEAAQSLANEVNGAAPGHLGALCRQAGMTALHVSTDYVFDGTKRRPYRETDPCAPLGAYGRSKRAGEERFLAAMQGGSGTPYVLRTSWLFGHHGHNFVATMLRLMQEREELAVVHDQVGRPTFCDDLATAALRLCGILPGGAPAAPGGTYHFANADSTSWHGFACAILQAARALPGASLRCRTVRPLSTAQYPTPAPRPAYSVLCTEKIEHALQWQPRTHVLALADYLRGGAAPAAVAAQ